MFRAFGDNQLLTFGSDRRYLDAEAEWRARLREHRRHAPPGAKGRFPSPARHQESLPMRVLKRCPPGRGCHRA